MEEFAKNRRGKALGTDELLRSKGASKLPLACLLARARQLEALDEALAQWLEPGLAPHVRVANIRDGALILITPVAPIATRLRMEQQRLIGALLGLSPEPFDKIEVLITPTIPSRD